MSRRSSRSRGASRGNIRTDRIGSTLREIIGDELTRIDDDSVAYVTVTDVEVDNELTLARVYLSSLNLDEHDIDGVRRHAGRIKKAIGNRTRLRRVPDLEFLVDPGLVAGNRVSEILAGMRDDRAFAAGFGETGDPRDEEE